MGREFYLIVKGEVEVVSAATGAPIARLGPREVFGEKALLEDTLRTATVRALGAVDVLVMSRADFRSMVTNFPPLSDYFRVLLEQRLPGMMERMPPPAEPALPPRGVGSNQKGVRVPVGLKTRSGAPS